MAIVSDWILPCLRVIVRMIKDQELIPSIYLRGSPRRVVRYSSRRVDDSRKYQ
jgi:hypothetical protein